MRFGATEEVLSMSPVLLDVIAFIATIATPLLLSAVVSFFARRLQVLDENGFSDEVGTVLLDTRTPACIVFNCYPSC